MDDVKKLATILFEELDRDGWGDIDFDYLEMLVDGVDMPSDPDDYDREAVEQIQALRQVLERVVKRLNPCPNCTVRAPCKEHDE